MSQQQEPAAQEIKLSRAEILAQRIAEKEKQVAELKAQKRKIEAKARVRESKAARKLDSRQKILIGAMTLAEAKRTAGGEDALKAKLDAFLTRDDERALFGLPPKAAQ